MRLSPRRRESALLPEQVTGRYAPQFRYLKARIALAGGNAKSAADEFAALSEGGRGIPPSLTGRLAPYKGQRVTLGVRPEDLHLAAGADQAPYVFDAVVDVVEPLGSEILLDVKAGPNSLVARVDPTVRLKVHDGVRLAVNPERLHFFDTTNEKAI